MRPCIFWRMFSARYWAVALGKPIFFIAEMDVACRELFENTQTKCVEVFFVLGFLLRALAYTAGFQPPDQFWLLFDWNPGFWAVKTGGDGGRSTGHRGIARLLKVVFYDDLHSF